ncbi:MAG: hypothetical protein ABR499_02970 [Gemmatimonadaceae bacterium]
MMRRMLPGAAFAAGAMLLGCFELSAPPSGLSAISPIAVAWPSVVEGDVLRDEDGNEARLHVDAYDGDGNLVTDATVNFVVLDPWLRVDSDGLVHGEEVRGTPARVVAVVRRGGEVLQTPEARIDVVPQPDSVTPTQDTTFSAKPIPVADPSPIPSDPLTVRVFGKVAGIARPVRSWIVRYDIVDEPAGVNGQHTAIFPGASGARFTFDTTDANGVAARAISLQRALLERATGPETVAVRATVRGAGTDGVNRSVLFTLLFDRP